MKCPDSTPRSPLHENVCFYRGLRYLHPMQNKGWNFRHLSRPSEMLSDKYSRWRIILPDTPGAILPVSRAALCKDQPLSLEMVPQDPGPQETLSTQVALCVLGYSSQTLSPEKEREECPSQRCPPRWLANHLIRRSNQTNYTSRTSKPLGN